MANINLYQTETDEFRKNQSGILDKGMMAGLALALLVTLAYVGG